MPRRVEPPPKECPVCGDLFYRRPKEELSSFLDRATCGKECGYKYQAQQSTGVPWRKGDAPRQYRDSSQYTQEEETEIGRSLLRRWIRAEGGFPSDGSPVFSPVKTYLPGSPEFEAVAATVTPIERIPQSRTEDRLWG